MSGSTGGSAARPSTPEALPGHPTEQSCRWGYLESLFIDNQRRPVEALQVQQPAQMRLRFGEEPGAASQPAVSLLPIEILVLVSGYTPNSGDGVQVHVASPPDDA